MATERQQLSRFQLVVLLRGAPGLEELAVYLGAYDEEESAARAYDLAALKYWGPTTFTNFPVTDYEKELQIMQNVTKEEYLASLRRKSSGFSRGVSKYRGVARHHHNGRWEARIGRVFGNKYLYLGTYSTQEEAAHAYDIAAIEYRGINAVTNFDLSTYIRWLRPGISNIMNNPQEAQPNTGQLQANIFPSNVDAQISLANRRAFTVDVQQLSCKHEFMPYQTTGGNKSSPTALGLLLKSSMFQQLVEKNSIVSNEDVDGEDVKDLRLQLEAGDMYNRIVYEGIVDSNAEVNEQGIWNGALGIQ
ncbi:uncharacterized protein A4U43_C08F5590 [Asparagus officinalis]|nr:uncharacterized protein A4U43_C08F5590 [Asparagus officinalis]